MEKSKIIEFNKQKPKKRKGTTVEEQLFHRFAEQEINDLISMAGEEKEKEVIKTALCIFLWGMQSEAYKRNYERYDVIHSILNSIKQGKYK
jgi:hypothetical protein